MSMTKLEKFKLTWELNHHAESVTELVNASDIEMLIALAEQNVENLLRIETKKSWDNELPLTIRQLQLTSHTLEILRIELEEDWCNCKDQWHDPDTGFNLVSNMKAFKSVQEEIDRKIGQLRDEDDEE